MQYLVVVTKNMMEFSCESDIAKRLETLGCSGVVYLPKSRSVGALRHMKSKRPVEVVKPLFGNYLFVGLSDSDMFRWKEILRSRFMNHIMCCGDSALFVSEAQIAEVRRQETLCFDLKRGKALEGVKKGDLIKVTSGPFEGMTGSYIGHGFVLLDGSKKYRVKIPRKMFEVK